MISLSAGFLQYLFRSSDLRQRIHHYKTKGENMTLSHFLNLCIMSSLAFILSLSVN